MTNNTFAAYQRQALTTAKSTALRLPYLIPGLCAEAGEVADKYAKFVRDDNGHLIDKLRESMKKELGDVLWFVAVTAHFFDLDLGEIAQANLAKLKSRQERGVIGGSGDDR